MENKVLKIGEVIKLGWHSLTARFGFWSLLVGISLVAGAIPLLLMHLMGGNVAEIVVIPQSMGDAVGKAASSAASMPGAGNPMSGGQVIIETFRNGADSMRGVHLLWIASTLFSTFLGLGWTNVALKSAYGENPTWKDFFIPMKSGKKFFSYLVGAILYALIVLAGILLLVFPAFIWGPRYSLWTYFVVRQNMGPIDALRASAATSMNAKFDLLGLFLLIGLFNIAGVAVFYIGVLVTGVLSELIKAQAFKALFSQTKLPPELTSGSQGQ